jgi:hypothetical protein
MGAALGTVTGWATVRYHHNREGNRLDDFFLGPAPSATSNGGVALTWGFKF